MCALYLKLKSSHFECSKLSLFQKERILSVQKGAYENNEAARLDKATKQPNYMSRNTEQRTIFSLVWN